MLLHFVERWRQWAVGVRMTDPRDLGEFGTVDLPADAAGRPLVTFALFAYNQEAYIREAVEGAFAQTYSPLEIILSDDCSTDRTFEIMQEMAAEYRGPHQVRVIRNQKNMGLVPHFLARCREAAGSIIVVAAGDDVSYPDRVFRHVPVYEDPSVFAVSGGFDVMDEESVITSRNNVHPIGQPLGKKVTSFFKSTLHPYVIIQGSTASYRRDVFSLPLPQSEILFSEDNLFNFIIYAHDRRVAFLELPLIAYRAHSAALSHRGKHKPSLVEFEEGSRKAAEKNLNKVQVYSWIAEEVGGDRFDFEGMANFKLVSKQIFHWPELSSFQRLMSLWSDLISFRTQLVKWKFFRIFGDFPAYQPKILLTRFLRWKQ